MWIEAGIEIWSCLWNYWFVGIFVVAGVEKLLTNQPIWVVAGVEKLLTNQPIWVGQVQIILLAVGVGFQLPSIFRWMKRKQIQWRHRGEFNSMSDSDKATVLTQEPSMFRWLRNPSQDLCLVAVGKDFDLIYEVSSFQRETLEFILKVISIYPEKILILTTLPFLKPCDFDAIQQCWFTAVSVDGLMLKYCPKEYQNFDTCLAAVLQNRLAIRYIHRNGILQNVKNHLPK